MAEFKTLLKRTGMSTRGASSLLGVRFDTVRNWKYGRTAVPENVTMQMTQYAQAAGIIFRGVDKK